MLKAAQGNVRPCKSQISIVQDLLALQIKNMAIKKHPDFSKSTVSFDYSANFIQPHLWLIEKIIMRI